LCCGNKAKFVIWAAFAFAFLVKIYADQGTDSISNDNSASASEALLRDVVNSESDPPTTGIDAADIVSEKSGSLKFAPAFINSLLMIIITELGDKTFFIAAILAMRHTRIMVFGGAIGALALMTVLSVLMGFALPNLIPRVYTHYASAALFFYFGVKLLKEGIEMTSSGPSEELAEVEEELAGMKKGDDEENGPSSQKSPPSNLSAKKLQYQVMWQAFTLTFLAEWGDRSQIATIALAAAKDPFGVTVGGVIGHALCTGLAVLGGRMLAAKISEKTVHLVGGALFLVFAIHSLFFEE